MKVTPENFKNIPAFNLHQVMMGSGALITKGKEIVLIESCYIHRLSCGCPGSKYIRYQDSSGKFVYEEIKNVNIDDYEYHLQPFQGELWYAYWEDYYNKNPSQRPILVDNS